VLKAKLKKRDKFCNNRLYSHSHEILYKQIKPSKKTDQISMMTAMMSLGAGSYK